MLPLTMIGRNVTFALLGAAALVLKHLYAGVGERVVHAYAGNFVVSFALYFAFLGAVLRFRYPRPLAAVVVFAVVTAFEVTNGFGVMANVYDPFDIAANAAGIGFAVLVDMVSWRVLTGSSRLRPAVTQQALRPDSLGKEAMPPPRPRTGLGYRSSAHRWLESRAPLIPLPA